MVDSERLEIFEESLTVGSARTCCEEVVVRYSGTRRSEVGHLELTRTCSTLQRTILCYYKSAGSAASVNISHACGSPYEGTVVEEHPGALPKLTRHPATSTTSLSTRPLSFDATARWPRSPIEHRPSLDIHKRSLLELISVSSRATYGFRPKA